MKQNSLYLVQIFPSNPKGSQSMLAVLAGFYNSGEVRNWDEVKCNALHWGWRDWDVG